MLCDSENARGENSLENVDFMEINFPSSCVLCFKKNVIWYTKLYAYVVENFKFSVEVSFPKIKKNSLSGFCIFIISAHKSWTVRKFQFSLKWILVCWFLGKCFLSVLFGCSKTSVF